MAQRPIPKSDLLHGLRRVGEQVSGHVTINQYRALGEYSEGPYYNQFGDWGTALEMAGVTVDADALHPTDGRRANVTESEFITDVQSVADKLGKTPSIREYEEHGKYSRFLVRARFETWNACVRAAGLEPNQPGSCDVTTREVLTVYFRDGLTMRETATELAVSKAVVQYHFDESPVPVIQSRPIRQILYSAPRPAEICDAMNKNTERKYGVATDGNECWIEPEYIYDAEVLAKVEQVWDYFDQ